MRKDPLVTVFPLRAIPLREYPDEQSKSRRRPRSHASASASRQQLKDMACSTGGGGWKRQPECPESIAHDRHRDAACAN